MSRIVIVPSETQEAYCAELRPRLAAISREIDANNLASLFNPRIAAWLETNALNSPGAFLIWAREGKGYAVAWAEEGIGTDLKGSARADAGEGLVARIFESGRSASLTPAEPDASEWTNLESLLGQGITSMSASPVAVFGNCAAAVTLVAFTEYEAPMPPPAEAAALLARLIEDRLLRMSIGLETA